MNSFSNLTLNFQSSILDGITLKENIDVNVLDKLINSTLLKETFNNPMAKIYHTEKNQLIKYKELIQDDGLVHVKYNRVKGMDCGRSNPDKSLGLFSIRREIRQTLSKEKYTDIDVDNCHPVILYQILKSNSIENLYLKSYIEHRQEWFDNINEHYNIGELCNYDIIKMKEIPKTLFIRIMYGGGLASWIKDFNITPKEPFEKLISFITSIKSNMELIMLSNPELTTLIERRKESQNKKDYNLCGSVCSYYLQSKECEILETVFIDCKNKGLIKNDSCVLCADGLMIETNGYYDNLLIEFENLIKVKFNINISFSEKKMTQDYCDILDNCLDFKLYNDVVTTGLLSNYFKILYSDKFMVHEEQLYKYNGVSWVLDPSKKSSVLHQFISHQFYNKLVKYSLIVKSQIFDKLKVANETDSVLIKHELSKVSKFEESINNFCNNIVNRNSLVDDIKHYITKNDIELDEKPYYFAFNNKIYDLKKGEFIKPNYRDYITITCGYDYDDNEDPNRVTELDTIINTIFTNSELKSYYLECLSTGLCGQQIENMFIATGAGGNGKSLINSLMMKAVGEYGYKMPSTLLMSPIKDGANPQVANLNKKRFTLTQEPDKSQSICSSTMKELTGDDSINTRKLYSGNCSIKLNLTLMVECNELPKIDEVNDAIIRRVSVIPFTSKFVDSSLYNELGQDEITNNNIFIGNNFYKSDEFKMKYRQSLIMILFQKFKDFVSNDLTLHTPPIESKLACNDYLALSDDIFDWFSNTYDSTTDGSSFIYFNDIFEIFTSSEYYHNLNKKEKRENNMKRFATKIEKCVFLKKNIKMKDTYYNGTRHRKPYVIGYKIPFDEDLGESDV
jgi:P4 family phage/plasmid primase-like protien